MAVRIIGAGFGRTGTTSTMAALEALGVGKCVHMEELRAKPFKAKPWYDRSRGRRVDWDAVFDGYVGTLDWPGCSFYKELLERYPDAKVILNVRDSNAWYRSMTDTVYGQGKKIPRWLRWFVPPSRWVVDTIDNVIWKQTFHGRFEDKAYAVSVYEDHIAEVKRTVPPDRLLVYEVSDGWAPLCDFLGVPVPATPFPRLNTTKSFQQSTNLRLRLVRAAAYGMIAVVVGMTTWFMIG